MELLYNVLKGKTVSLPKQRASESMDDICRKYIIEQIKTVQIYTILNKLLLETLIAYLFLEDFEVISEFLCSCNETMHRSKNLKYLNLHGFQQCQPLLPDACLSHRPKQIQTISKLKFSDFGVVVGS